MSAQAAARAATHAAKQGERTFLNSGAKRDPELYVRANSPYLPFLLLRVALFPIVEPSGTILTFLQILGAVMCGAFGLAGYYFGKKRENVVMETAPDLSV